ncbi:MAG TPA: ABC transporter permease, partial [Candidatus Sulfopaludibacter sp.]|nr:ABC transporter permease [Candidatus Sulfopaludibacter sp.]
ELVTGNYFQALGVPAVLGRTLTPQDDLRAAPSQVAVIGYDYWKRAFDGRRDALGRTLHVDKAAFTVVGVAPPEFFGISVGEVPDVWAPVTTLPSVLPGSNWLDGKNTNFLDIVGRLKPGVSRARAAAELSPLRIQIDLERNGPPARESDRRRLYAGKLRLTPASQGISGMRDRFSKPLRVVFWMVTLGLLLACVNVMSLQFARADERRRELTVRLAIGASRFRIGRQLLAESLVIAAASGAVGLAMFRPVAHGLAGMMTMWGDHTLRLSLPVSYSILLFVTGISVAAALISGVAPAMRATRGNMMPGLQQGTRGSTASPARRAIGRTVAVAQITLSLVLVAGTCLFAYNLHRLRQFDSGVRRERLLVVDIDPAAAGLKDAALIRMNMRLRDRLAVIPGVAAVSFSQNGIYSGRNYDTGFDADGFAASAPGNHQSIYDHVGPYFFTAAGAHIVAGRDFDERDEAGAPGVTIVTKSFAKRVFGDRSPVGLNLYVATSPKEKATYQIVGVVSDIRTDVREPLPMFYLRQLQSQVQAF